MCRHPAQRNYLSPHRVQASPSDPDNFPFVVLGNKVDVEGGRTRQVRQGGKGEGFSGQGQAAYLVGGAGASCGLAPSTDEAFLA